MTDPTYPDFITFRRGHPPQTAAQEESVRVYADLNGVLRTLQSDGTDAAIAGSKSAVVDISSAEILALHTSPIEVVPAQGVGTVIIPFVFATQYTHVSTAYVLGGDVHYSYDTDPTTVLCTIGVDMTLTHSQIAPFGGRPLVQDFGGTNLAGAENLGLTLVASSADPTTGNGSLRSAVQYFVFELA